MSERHQVRVPRPPERSDTHHGARERAGTSVIDSYRVNIVRVQATNHPFDIVPIEAEQNDRARRRLQVAPEVGDPGPLHVIAASHGSSEPSTPMQDVRAARDLHEVLDQRGWDWDPAVVLPPGREWCQVGAAVRGVPLSDVLHLAHDRRQEAVLTWSHGVLVATPTGLGPDLLDPVTVQAGIRPVTPGCPMRFGGVDGVCVRDGGPFTGSSMRAALVWEHHRSMLVAALGCSTCAGGNVSKQGRPYGSTDMITPSRRGGWAWGPPRDDLVDPTQRISSAQPDHQEVNDEEELDR